jgi:hypothetical protein
MEQTSEATVIYAPRGDATSEAGLKALAAVYKFVLFDCQANKGGTHDLTNKASTTAEGANKDKKGQDRYVRR